MSHTPVDVTLDPRYSYPGAQPDNWSDTLSSLAAAEVYWLATVLPSGAPHVTPVAGAWHDGGMWVCALPAEQKVRNLLANPQCTILTGSNALAAGLDITVMGEAARVTSEHELEKAAGTFRSKYGAMWDYQVNGDELVGSVGRAWGIRIMPRTAFAFCRDNGLKQTRWRFAQ